jgi:hypothetical protein
VHGREGESVEQKHRRAHIILGPPERPFRPFPRAGSVHADVHACAMIHGEILQEFFAFSLPLAPSPDRVNHALEERARGKGLAFNKGDDGFAV